MKNFIKIFQAFKNEGYKLRNKDRMAIKGLLSVFKGVKGLLIEGLPGVGKTFFAEVLAKALNAKYLYHLCTEGTDEYELFQGIHISAVVAGKAEDVDKPGVLLKAAKSSREQLTVLCLDEIDKMLHNAESMLLTFLESGAVQIGPGELFQANLNNLIVIMTSNGYRELNDAFYRRFRRLHMDPLEADDEIRILMDETGKAYTLCRKVRYLAKKLVEDDDKFVSVKEMINIINELDFVESFEDIVYVFEAWAVKGPEGKKALEDNVFKNILQEIEQCLEK